MKRICYLLALLFICQSVLSQNAPLRVFILSSGNENSATFVDQWRQLLNERGAKASTGGAFPSAEQLRQVDVLVLHGSNAVPTSAGQRQELENFVKRGGGLVLLNEALKTPDAEWLKGLAGGAWQEGKSKSRDGLLGLYFGDYQHPVTEGISNFDLTDSLFYDLTMAPEAKVIGTSFQTAKHIVPQIWTYEKNNGRVFVAAQGNSAANLNLPHYRGLLFRGIAWAGKKSVDSLTSTLEQSTFRYPAGGPTLGEQAASKIHVHKEFNISLVAAEPMVVKPISHDWDAKGRLWVAITPEYPFKTDSAPAKDSIIILEDSNKDGVMDKRSVFFEGLKLVTSFVFHKDGVIVAQAPQILFIRDTNQDGKADKTEVLYDGFGTYDTHAVISNFRWGLDGWVYGTQGYSGNRSENVTGAGGKSFGKIGNGVIRFKPDGTAMEVVTSFGGNTWGLDFTWDNELFFSKANGPHVSHVVVPEKYIQRGRIGNTTSDKSVEDHQKVYPIFGDQRHEYVQVAPVGLFTGASGSMIYEGGAWPERFHGSYFTAEPTVHIVHEDILIRAESVSYEATKREEAEFIAATDLWFRPVHMRFGPDGAMYILDFYNQAISHNDIRGIEHGPGNAAVRPDRDHKHGRIWRVQHKEARSFAAPNFENLVAVLEHPNGWARNTAQRLLIEKGGTNAVSELGTLLVKSRYPYAKVHALWTLGRLGALTEEQALAALKDDHFAVINNTLQVLTEGLMPHTEDLESATRRLLREKPERVRLNALIALSTWNLEEDSKSSVVRTAASAKDNWSRSVIVSAASADPYYYLDRAYAADKPDDLREVIAVIAKQAAAKRDQKIFEKTLELIAKRSGTERTRTSILNAFAQEFARGYNPQFTEEVGKQLKKLLDSSSRSTRLAVLPVAVQFADEVDSREVVADFTEELEDPKTKDDDRVKVMTGLLSVNSLQQQVFASMDKLLQKAPAASLQKQVVEELGEQESKEAAGVIIRNYRALSPEVQALAFSTLAKKAASANLLIAALEEKDLQPADLGVQNVSRLRMHADKAIAKRAVEVLNKLQGPETQEKEALIARFRTALEKPGDAAKGKELYAQNCGICHKFGKEGKEFGPDLTGIGVHGGSVLLVHILDPNRVVEGNFVPYNLTTKDQEEYFGLLARENRESVTLRNLEGDKEINRSEIARLSSTGRSMMPEGLEALGEEGIRDIIAFLTENTPKGYLALDLSRAFTADSRKGLYAENGDDASLPFTRFGIVSVEEVPFNLVNPVLMPNGKNLIVLKGGIGFAATLPQKVEVPINTRASKLHFLGGVGGWGFPYGKSEDHYIKVAKITLHYADGSKEEKFLQNGKEIADYIQHVDVPNSQYVPDLLAKGQIRMFSITPSKAIDIKQMTIESLGTHVAPTFAAVTVQVGK